MFDNLEEDHKRVCVLRYESVHENLKILLAATMVLSLIGTVLNAVMMVTVSRDQFRKTYEISITLYKRYQTSSIIPRFLAPQYSAYRL